MQVLWKVTEGIILISAMVFAVIFGLILSPIAIFKGKQTFNDTLDELLGILLYPMVALQKQITKKITGS